MKALLKSIKNINQVNNRELTYILDDVRDILDNELEALTMEAEKDADFLENYYQED